MAKRYVVQEDSGCGCGGLFLAVLFFGFIIGHWQIILAIIAVIGAIIWIIYWPKHQAKKQQAAEEAALAKRRCELELEQQRLELEQRERELAAKRKQLYPDEQLTEDSAHKNDEDWSDF